jgi:hypothetical protein
MIARATALICMVMIAASAMPAGAAPKSSTGKTCESTGTERRDGKDDQGNKVNCLFDTCTYSECSTSGGQISNCVRKTEYSNARDCKAAARTGMGAKLPTLRNGTMLRTAQ